MPFWISNNSCNNSYCCRHINFINIFGVFICKIIKDDCQPCSAREKQLGPGFYFFMLAIKWTFLKKKKRKKKKLIYFKHNDIIWHACVDSICMPLLS